MYIFVILSFLSLTLYACSITKYSNDTFDRRANKYELTIAEYNVEFLFTDVNSSCSTYHQLSCPGDDCRWNNESMALQHMQYLANVIIEIDVDILLLVEVEDCCTLRYFYNNYLSNTFYNYYLIKGSDSYTGQNVALLTKIDPINDIIRYKDSAPYPIDGSLCTDTISTGTKTISKNLVADFSGIENFPDFVLIGVHLLAQPSNQGRCLEREAQAAVVRDIINGYNDNDNYNDFVVLGDFNDYDCNHDINEYESCDANNHSSITNVLPYIKESVTPNLINTVKYLYPQNKRYTHWPQSTFNPSEGDICGYGNEYKSYIDQYDYILLSDKLASFVDNVTIKHNYCDIYSSDHLPLIVKLQAPYTSNDYIASFGFKTSSSSSYSGGNAQTYVYIKLWWNQYIFQCKLYAPESDTFYLCDATNSFQTENCNDDDDTINIESKYEMIIQYKSSNQLFIDEIMIKDVSNNIYEINGKFCISNDETETIGEGQGVSDVNCSGSDYLRYNDICLDDECVDAVKISFVDDPINDSQNSNKYGIISSIDEDISNGLICTSSPTTDPIIDSITSMPSIAPSVSRTDSPTLNPETLRSTPMSPTVTEISDTSGVYAMNDMFWFFISLVCFIVCD